VKLIILISLAVFCSCGISEQNPDLPDISQSNRIIFSFKTDFDASGKMNIKTLEISDVKKVSDVKKIISNEPFNYIYCASTGSMSFYKDEALLSEMVFNTTPELKHIACNYKGKLVAIKLSGEDAEFLENLKN
jgi:hypothetical protein